MKVIELTSLSVSASSDLGGLPWAELREGEGEDLRAGRREAERGEGAGRAHGQRAGPVHRRGSLRPQRLRLPRRENRHLEGGIEEAFGPGAAPWCPGGLRKFRRCEVDTFSDTTPRGPSPLCWGSLLAVFSAHNCTQSLICIAGSNGLCAADGGWTLVEELLELEQ